MKGFLMTLKVRNIIMSVLSLGVLIAPVALTASAGAAPSISSGLCSGATNLQLTTTPSNDCSGVNGDNATSQFNSLLTNAVNIFSVIVGVIAVIMIIVGGFRYITSGGDSGKVSAAKSTIIYAIVGLIIVAVAQFVVRFVLAKTTSSVAG